MADQQIETEHSNTTTIRLDLRKTNGWSKLSVLRAFVAECEANGATDDTAIVVANLGEALLGTVYKPIIGAHINHKAAAPAPLHVEDGNGGEAP